MSEPIHTTDEDLGNLVFEVISTRLKATEKVLDLMDTAHGAPAVSLALVHHDLELVDFALTLHRRRIDIAWRQALVDQLRVLERRVEAIQTATNPAHRCTQACFQLA